METYVESESSGPEQIDNNAIQILYDDDNILALLKPAGMHSKSKPVKNTSIETLLPKLSKQLSTDGLFLTYPLHRLHSGIVLLSKNKETHGYLANQMNQHFLAQRVLWQKYHAVTVGLPEPRSSNEVVHLARLPVGSTKLSVCISSENAENTGRTGAAKRKLIRPSMSYNVLKHNSTLDLSYMELLTENSKWEAIQSFLCSKKCPVLGDDRYGSLCTTLMGKKTLIPHADYSADRKQELPSQVEEMLPRDSAVNRTLLLHRSEITIKMRKKPITIHAPLPKYFTDFLKLSKLLVK